MHTTSATGRDEDMIQVAVTASKGLQERLADLTDRVVANIVGDDPGYLTFVPHDELWQTVHAILGESIDHMGRRALGEEPALELAERIGRRRAEQGLPLESVLHAFRIGGRLCWDAMIEVLAELDPESLPQLLKWASLVWATNEAQSVAVSESYRRTESELLRRSTERVHALVDSLLEGRGADGGLAKAAAAALDLPLNGRYAVVMMRAARTDSGYARPDRLDGMRLVWRLRADAEVALVELGDRTSAAVATALDRLLDRPAGLSPVAEGLAGLGRARWLAELALGACRPRERGVARLEERLPAALVVAQPDLGAQLGATVLGPLDGLDPADREILLETLAAWLDCEGSAARTAGRLYCHRNTVFNRLRRIEQLTARSLHRPRDVVELALALEAIRLLDG